MTRVLWFCCRAQWCYSLFIDIMSLLYIHTLSHDLQIQLRRYGTLYILVKFRFRWYRTTDIGMYIWGKHPRRLLVDLHWSMDFMNFLKLSARLRQWIHSSMAKDYSILFMRLCLVEIHPQFETLRNGLFNRQLRHDYSIIGGCCISDSDFDPCQGVIVSELSLQIFLGDTVTRCDRLHFPTIVISLITYFPSDTEWSRTRVGRSRAS